jgi:predicted DNA-binding protein
MSNKEAKRFLSIRLSADELQEVYNYQHQSTCRSLTEYVKKVLTSKPVNVKVRDEAKEDTLQQLVAIKNRLDALTERTEPATNGTLLGEIADIKLSIRKIAESCSPK